MVLSTVFSVLIISFVVLNKPMLVDSLLAAARTSPKQSRHEVFNNLGIGVLSKFKALALLHRATLRRIPLDIKKGPRQSGPNPLFFVRRAGEHWIAGGDWV